MNVWFGRESKYFHGFGNFRGFRVIDLAVKVLLKELGLLNTISNTYQHVNDTIHNILQQQNNILDSVFGLKKSDDEINCLPCIYWLPKNV